MNDYTETKLSSEEIFKGRVLHVFRDRVRLTNGRESTREYIRHPGAVCLVPLTAEGEILMVRQYRYPFGKMLLEVPAGKLDPGESPRDAALRELSEETGAEADELIDLGDFYPSVAYTDEVIHTYLARGLRFAAQHPDADEFLDVERIPLSTLVADVVAGRIRDGKTQAAILKAEHYLRAETK